MIRLAKEAISGRDSDIRRRPRQRSQVSWSWIRALRAVKRMGVSARRLWPLADCGSEGKNLPREGAVLRGAVEVRGASVKSVIVSVSKILLPCAESQERRIIIIGKMVNSEKAAVVIRMASR